MSDNNNQNKGIRGKDSFSKPGDENIVSGKSFFLSFGKQKKSSANPLIQSEKNKNKAKNVREQNNSSQGEKQNRNQQDNRQDKPKDRNNYKGKHHGHHHGDRNQNQNREKQNIQPVNNIAATAQEAAAQETRQEKSKGNFRYNKHKGKGKDRRDNRPGNNNPMPRTEEKHQDKNSNFHQNDRHDRKHNAKETVVTERLTPPSVAPEKDTVIPFAERRHQKHKKEKFVPSVPQTEITKEDLLQPIVDKSTIISSPVRGFGMRTGKSFTTGADSLNAKDSENEPRYIDRNRPLAEQIIEQSKPKTYKNHLTENTDTVEVIGVRFREAGKVYYFAPGDNKIEKGQAVIVETARGVEYGFCAIGNRFVSEDNIVQPLKSILRIATAADTERYQSNKQLEEGAAKIFREKVKMLGLEMSLVYVEYTFDNGKLLFYFTADGRVDFRELIKELASAFKTRIELRQIGVRDEAKIVGGLGICGRPVCCKSFLGEFSQVSIKMAKDQNLFINSSKISGTCGRFMCCIRYEDEVYQKEYERTPKVDAIVETPEGRGVVVESNALKGTVKVLLDDKPESVAMPFKCTDIKLLGYLKRENENEIPDGVEIPEDEN